MEMFAWLYGLLMLAIVVTALFVLVLVARTTAAKAEEKTPSLQDAVDEYLRVMARIDARQAAQRARQCQYQRDSYVRGGLGLTVSSAEASRPAAQQIDLMKALADKLRKDGFTVTCVIQPPPATRKL